LPEKFLTSVCAHSCCTKTFPVSVSRQRYHQSSLLFTGPLADRANSRFKIANSVPLLRKHVQLYSGCKSLRCDPSVRLVRHVEDHPHGVDPMALGTPQPTSKHIDRDVLAPRPDQCHHVEFDRHVAPRSVAATALLRP